MAEPPITPAQMDVDHLAVIRRSVEEFQRAAIERWVHPGGIVLDVAPQVHAGVATMVPEGTSVETLDLDPEAGATYTADLCERNEHVPAERFDCIFCTEVLEHTLQPFDAARELWRLLRPGGRLLLSSPFNFRIHGPLPDCWRFTEHGLRALLREFDEVEIQGVETPGRPLMPIHYTVSAARPAT